MDLHSILDFPKDPNAQSFADYIIQRQIDTTMPFNDYWPDGLPVGSATLPVTPLKWIGIVAAVALAAWLLALLLNGVFTVFGVDGGFVRLVAKVTAWGAVIVPLHPAPKMLQ